MIGQCQRVFRVLSSAQGSPILIESKHYNILSEISTLSQLLKGTLATDWRTQTTRTYNISQHQTMNNTARLQMHGSLTPAQTSPLGSASLILVNMRSRENETQKQTRRGNRQLATLLPHLSFTFIGVYELVLQGQHSTAEMLFLCRGPRLYTPAVP